MASPPSSTTNLHPCIAELLRTEYAPPTLTLRISKILIAILGTQKQAYRLFLTDDALLIQAVLKAEIHRFIVTGEVGEGDVIVVEKYELRKGARVNGEGEVWYLGIGNFRPAFPTTHSAAVKEAAAVPNQQDGEDVQEYGVDSRSTKRRRIDAASPQTLISSPTRANVRRSKQRGFRETREDSGDSDGAFESTVVNPQDLNSRPHTLRELTQGIQKLNRQPESESPGALRDVNQEHEDESHGSDSDITRGEDHQALEDDPILAKQQAIPTNIVVTKNPLNPITHPLNLVTLSDLSLRSRELSRPMRRNYICDVFAVVSYVSPDLILRLKLPPQRNIRIVDPTCTKDSSSQGVLLTVLTEAKSFIPEVGTVGLFRRLRTHEWEGFSLKAYEVDCKGKEWFVTDARKLVELGLDIGAMKGWWEERYQALEP